MQDFTRLQVWRRAQALAEATFFATERLRGNNEASGLRSQLRRATVSIAANIAEGSGAGGPAQFARYLQMAISSTSEVQSHLDLAARLRVIPAERISALVAEAVAIRRMLVVLRRRVIEGAQKQSAADAEAPTTENSNPQLKTQPPTDH